MSPFHSLYSTVLRWLRWTLSRLYLCTSSIINCKTEIPHITHWKYSSNFGFHMTQTLQWRLFMLQLSHSRLQYQFFSFSLFEQSYDFDGANLDIFNANWWKLHHYLFKFVYSKLVNISCPCTFMNSHFGQHLWEQIFCPVLPSTHKTQGN